MTVRELLDACGVTPETLLNYEIGGDGRKLPRPLITVNAVISIGAGEGSKLEVWLPNVSPGQELDL